MEYGWCPIRIDFSLSVSQTCDSNVEISTKNLLWHMCTTHIQIASVQADTQTNKTNWNHEMSLYRFFFLARLYSIDTFSSHIWTGKISIIQTMLHSWIIRAERWLNEAYVRVCMSIHFNSICESKIPKKNLRKLRSFRQTQYDVYRCFINFVLWYAAAAKRNENAIVSKRK